MIASPKRLQAMLFRPKVNHNDKLTFSKHLSYPRGMASINLRVLTKILKILSLEQEKYLV